MHDEAFELAELISGYLLGTLTTEQEQRLMFLLQEDPERYKLLEAYSDASLTEQRLANIHQLDVDAAWQKINNRFQTPEIEHKPRFSFLKYAAVFVALAGAFAYYLNSNTTDPRIVPDLTKTYKNDVLPGSQTATLILSDGRKVVLGDQKQAIVDKNGITITSQEGEISYHNVVTNSPEVIQYNTLLVPNAGTYSLVLPDGTKVILNAMSELKFPVVFSEKERKIELKGEAYFEVAKDKAHPFKVKLNESEVEVLGTNFNVSSYGKIAETTLLEGSVKVSNGKGSRILIPGNQSLADAKNLKVSKGDAEKAVAWCKGEFYFDNDPIESALIEISRWYDLTLVYKKKLPNIHITGQVKRKKKLSEVLAMLRDVSSLSFDIEDKNLIIN